MTGCQYVNGLGSGSPFPAACFGVGEQAQRARVLRMY